MKIKSNHSFRSLLHSRLFRLGIAMIIITAVASLGVLTARAVTILSVAGFGDFSYGTFVTPNPTDGRPESKLWFNDGIWWGSLYNPTAFEYQIYRLDWDSQDWVTTGVTIDGREESRADALWDEVNQKLYIVSHFKLENPTESNNDASWARLYRYSYNTSTDTYTMDAGYNNPGVRVNRDKTRTLVLDKDSTGRLWVTYVSKALNTTEYKVYVNSTTTSNVDNTWGTPYALPFPEATVNQDAVASVVSFTDNEGAKTGVVWSNELVNEYGDKFYFATHLDSAPPGSGWVLQTGFTDSITYPANNHINIAESPTDQLFFAVKTEAAAGQPMIALVARDTDGTYSFHSISTSLNDTRPIAIYYAGSPDPGDEYVYVFTSSSPAGEVICYVRAAVTSPLSDMDFTPANCSTVPGPSDAPLALADTNLYTSIRDATSTKQVMTEASDIVVLAADISQSTYVHAVLNTQFPYVTSVLPAPDSTVPNLTPLIRATFSQAMDGTTINTSSFTLVNSLGSVTGSVNYNSSTHAADFVPSGDLVYGEIYTATLTSAITNPAGRPLLNTPYSWSFRTPVPPGSAPGAFNKTSPTNGATEQPLALTLTWGASSGATSYEYCYDTSDDNACTSWVSTGTATSVGLSGLSLNTPYYWHVRANNSFGTTYSNELQTAFWSFTTGDIPGAFAKTDPSNGATGQPLDPTLSWGASSGATSYDYCIDTTAGDTCTTSWVDNGTATSVALSGLSLNTPYYWHVRAVNGFGTTYSNGLSTAFWSFTTGNIPGAFAKTGPTDGATGVPLNPTLSWGSSTGASSYEYCYDTTDDDACASWIANGTATSVGLSGLSLNTTYYWHVRAVNGFGPTYSNGSSTAFWMFTTGNVPGAFGKVAPADGAIGLPVNPTLTWSASNGATSYEYCYNTTNACSAWTSVGLNNSVQLTGLSLNTLYYWHVRAVNSFGTTSSDGLTTAFWSFTTGNTPAAFNKISPSDGATEQPLNPTLSWGSSNGATSYEYCFGITNPCTNWTSNGTATSVGLSGLSQNTTYYWQVRAVNDFGMTYANGSFWSFTTTGNTPGAFVKTAPSDGAVGQPLDPTLSWASSNDATSYEYCFNTTASCTSWVDNGTATSVGLSGLSLNTTYYWHVRAINAHGTTYSNGSSTAFWSFTTTGNAPGAFGKTAPADGATGLPLNPTLSWSSSTGASSYEYCYDTSDDDACTNWLDNGTATSVGLSGLTPDTTYYWHVRAINSFGTTYSNGSDTAYWSFTTNPTQTLIKIFLPVVVK